MSYKILITGLVAISLVFIYLLYYIGFFSWIWGVTVWCCKTGLFLFYWGGLYFASCMTSSVTAERIETWASEFESYTIAEMERKNFFIDKAAQLIAFYLILFLIVFINFWCNSWSYLLLGLSLWVLPLSVTSSFFNQKIDDLSIPVRDLRLLYGISYVLTFLGAKYYVGDMFITDYVNIYAPYEYILSWFY